MRRYYPCLRHEVTSFDCALFDCCWLGVGKFNEIIEYTTRSLIIRDAVTDEKSIDWYRRSFINCDRRSYRKNLANHNFIVHWNSWVYIFMIQKKKKRDNIEVKRNYFVQLEQSREARETRSRRNCTMCDDTKRFVWKIFEFYEPTSFIIQFLTIRFKF